ncbi:MAG: 1-deoxy-D-xylulose-5-phosphate synthase [Phycisphaerae bacterium]|nr:1-deoxy-D-xylulose-5-phosphate synthase [Phycisphaerae bacterium]
MGYLEKIEGPTDLRRLSMDQLEELAEEIRRRIVEVVSRNGGHLSSNLGVTELTIALHRTFDFSRSRLLWDVGHQCYPHKLLTGRNRRFDTLRQAGGVSGFPSNTESEYDLFDVGHAGTAIATAVGLARGDQMLGRDAPVVALVGDASIVNGVAFEGLNQAGTLKRQFLVVLNDNTWGISPTQGAISEHLAKFRSSRQYDNLKRKARELLPKLPLVGKPMFDTLDMLKEGIKATLAPHQIFEQLGFQYVGPIDGHDIAHLVEMLDILKDVQHPVLLHVHTDKGHGCDWAMADPGKFHSPKPFKVEAGKVTIHNGPGKSWTSAFVENLLRLAEGNDRVFALTAAMPGGTGLDKFAERFPERVLDCGIAESCTVDIAAGLARAGMRPVVAIYSTFLQRGFDQIFQEVALQGLPVLFCVDRAGLVGGDGAVHHGFLDIAYLRGLPGMVLAAPADELELYEALKLGLSLPMPMTIRYPRANVPDPLGDCPPFVPGVSRKVRSGDDATILAYGTMTMPALDAAELLSVDGVEVAVVNARFAKPIDRDMVAGAFAGGGPVVTVEDHSICGGFGSAVLESAQEQGLDTSLSLRLGLPTDRFIAHGARSGQLAEVNLDAAGIASAVMRLLERSIDTTGAGHTVRPALARDLGLPVEAGGVLAVSHRRLSELS